jgi:hypothetical protein
MNVKGIPTEVHTGGRGEWPCDATVREWDREYYRLRLALTKVSLDGYNSALLVVVAMREIAPIRESAAVKVLVELAYLNNFLSRNAHPFTNLPPPVENSNAQQKKLLTSVAK